MSDQTYSHSPPDNLRLTPELSLVIACSWIPESALAMNQNHIIWALSKVNLDWDEVVSLVVRHGVVGQFCTVMGTIRWLNVPSETRDCLKSMRSQQAVRALGQVAELNRIGRLFTNAGIRLIPLKGVALSQQLYGDPCIRSSGDIDILVCPEDIGKADEILLTAGYNDTKGFINLSPKKKQHIKRVLHHHEYINDVRGVHVELHWRSCLWTEAQVALLWQNSDSFFWLDAGLLQLSKMDNIIYLADHGAHHDWFCLKWLSDLAMLMHDLSEDEWLSVYYRAESFDLQRVICQTAWLVNFFYGVRLPEKIEKLVDSDPILNELYIHAASQVTASAVEVQRQLNRFYGVHHAIRLKKLKPSTNLTDLWQGIFILPADFMELSLPDYLFWLYLPLRPFFWFKRHYLQARRD